MKKIKYYIIILFLIIAVTGFLKVKRYGYYHNEFVLKYNLKHFNHIKSVEKLLHSLLYDDRPSQFWMEHYNYKDPERAFYHWKVLFSHDNVSKADMKNFQFAACEDPNTDECGLIDIRFPRHLPTLSTGVRENKYDFYYGLNRCLDHPNLDKNLDGVVNLLDYKLWEQVKKDKRMPQWLIDKHAKREKEFEEWKKNRSNELGDLDNISSELDELDIVDSLKQ